MTTIRDAMSQTEADRTDHEVEPPEDAYTDTPAATSGITPDGEAAWIHLLQADTPADQIHQRQAMARNGQPVMVNGQPLTLDYVTARFVQDRLDAAVGPMNWQTVFESLPDGSVRCGIGVRSPGSDSYEWVTKYDVGVPSNIEPQKGAHSDAFKRAAVHWGIARDLYDDRDEKALNAPTAGPQQDGQQMQQQPRMDAPIGQGFTGQQQMTAEQVVGQGGQAMAWVCPIHNDAKIVPAGQSKKPPYRQYGAFYACTDYNCNQKGPSVGQ